MKFVSLISIICAAIALVGCGGNSSAGPPSTDSDSAARALFGVLGSPIAPKIKVPPGPPPKDLIVKVLKRGSGPRATAGKRLIVQYVVVKYKTGKVFESRWGRTGGFTFRLGIGEVRKGWDIGLKGMKVGGRRELILPSRLAYGTGALIYVVELLGFEEEIEGIGA